MHENQPRSADADRQCPVLTDIQPDPFSETNMYTPCHFNSDMLVFLHADISEIDIHLTIHVQIPSKASFPEKQLYDQQWVLQSIVCITGWKVQGDLSSTVICTKGTVLKSKQRQRHRYGSQGGLRNQMRFNLGSAACCVTLSKSLPLSSPVSSSRC